MGSDLTAIAITFHEVTLPFDEFSELEHDAGVHGHLFLMRLRNNWTDAVNRFDAPGDCLLGAYTGTQLVAVGGLSRDPYTDDARNGRLRHVYVHDNHRERGIARRHASELLARNTNFETIRLRSVNPVASQVYGRLGFIAIIAPTATHTLATP